MQIKYGIIFISLILSLHVKAESTNIPKGKYLMLIPTNNDKFKLPINVIGNNIMQVFFANGNEPITLAEQHNKGDKIILDFIPLLDSLSGAYNFMYLAKGCFKLYNKHKELLFFPFIEQEIAVHNKDIHIQGKWHIKNNDEELTLNFTMPNIVEISIKNKTTNKKDKCFWMSQINGEDVTISSSLYFNAFTGTLKQIYVSNNILHFDYNGKHYKMNKL